MSAGKRRLRHRLSARHTTGIDRSKAASLEAASAAYTGMQSAPAQGEAPTLDRQIQVQEYVRRAPTGELITDRPSSRNQAACALTI